MSNSPNRKNHNNNPSPDDDWIGELIVDVTLTANRTPYGVADHTRTIALPADGATTRVAFSSIL